MGGAAELAFPWPCFGRILSEFTPIFLSVRDQAGLNLEKV
jgi:hypothetical protein